MNPGNNIQQRLLCEAQGVNMIYSCAGSSD